MRAVSLPDLSRVAESVRQQVRERYSALEVRLDAPGTTTVDLGNTFGEVGMLLIAAGYFDAAEPYFLNAQALEPDEVRWRYYLGYSYKMTGQPAKAAALFERTLQLRPDDVGGLIWLGGAYLDQGRPAEAEPLFAKALSLNPRSLAARFGWGRAALAKRDYALAVDQLEQALALDPQASYIHYPLAMAYRGRGRLDEAEAQLQLRRGAETGPPDPLMQELNELLDSPMAYQSRGIRAMEHGQSAAAAAYFRKAVELDPRRASLRHRLGTALFLTGDVGGASAQFQEALRLSPTFGKAHYSLGAILASQGRYAAAMDRFAAAVRYEPDNVEARVALADMLRGTGRSQESLPHYEQILRVDPRDAEARFGLGMALVRLRRYQEALEQLSEGAKLKPDRLEFVQALTRLLAAAPDDRVRNGRRAMDRLQGLRHEPRSPELSETIAMASAEVGQFEEAATWQRDAMAAAVQAGHHDLAQRMAANLELYESHRPCRAPWRDGEAP
jgi:tetratricopeptide (TPR) repeat protein